jgi:hypothetical protein
MSGFEGTQVLDPQWTTEVTTAWDTEVFRFEGDLETVLRTLAEVLEPANITSIKITRSKH